MRISPVRSGRAAALIALLALTGVALVHAQPDRPQRPDAPAQAAEQLTFAQNMKGMGRSLRALKRATENLEAPDALERAYLALHAFQTHALGAKSTFIDVPMSEHARNEYGEDQHAYHNGLRHHLIESLEHALMLERAIMKKDLAAVTKALNELEELEHHAHDEFQSED